MKSPYDVCQSADGRHSSLEVEAFEKFARDAGMDMREHPLHYLFLNDSTYAARKAWKAAIEFMSNLQQEDAPQPIEILRKAD